jgi:hypothetical protein
MEYRQRPARPHTRIDPFVCADATHPDGNTVTLRKEERKKE